MPDDLRQQHPAGNTVGVRISHHATGNSKSSGGGGNVLKTKADSLHPLCVRGPETGSRGPCSAVPAITLHRCGDIGQPEDDPGLSLASLLCGELRDAVRSHVLRGSGTG